MKQSVDAVAAAMGEKGVRAVIFKSPCIALVRPDEPKRVDPAACTACMRCINEIGCPALITDKDHLTDKGRPKAVIDAALCTGCGLCAQICPAQAIK